MQKIIVYYDPEADFLELLFEVKPGIMRATEDPHVLRHVDLEGNLLGFCVEHASRKGFTRNETDFPASILPFLPELPRISRERYEEMLCEKAAFPWV